MNYALEDLQLGLFDIRTDSVLVKVRTDTVVARFFRWVCCHLGYHRRCLWETEGYRCVDCGYFRSKAEVMADWHAGFGVL